MSYTKVNNVPCAATETVVQLDTGHFVAVQCLTSRTPAGGATVFRADARNVSVEGVTQLDASSRPIAVSFPTTVSAGDAVAMTAAVVTKECLLLVLGETLTPDAAHAGITIIPWSAEVVAQGSIRNAIASAAVTAPHAGEVL